MSLTGNNVLGGASGAATNQPVFAIDQSLRFNDGDSPKLTRTPSSASNRKTWTLSLWMKRGNLGTPNKTFFSASDFQFYWHEDKLKVYEEPGGSIIQTTAVYRDPSAWYHIVLALDTTQGVSADRLKLYVNGDQVTAFGISSYPAEDAELKVNNTVEHCVSSVVTYGEYYEGYVAETHFIDGQALTPSSFGEEDSDTGQWKPIKYSGTYGTNGFYQKYQDSSALGDDSSGNGNDFTSSGLVATDVVKDSPTNNYCTFNPLDINPNMLLSNGNLYSDGVTANWEKVRGTFGVSSGKYYWELNLVSTSYGIFGVADSTMDILGTASAASGAWAYSTYGTKYINGAGGAPYGATCTTGDIIGVALDMDGGNIEFFKNDTSQGELSLGLSGNIMPYCSLYTSDLIANFGQDSSFAGNETAQGNTDDNGEGDFYYEPPSGYLALCTDNLPSPEIADPTAHFNTNLWTGNGSTGQSINVGFQPDLLIAKERTTATYVSARNSVTGVTKSLFTALTNAEYTETDGVTAFTSTGFNLSGDGYGYVNRNTYTYVGWNWKAGGAAVTNDDGSIDSEVSANTTAGFSIVSWTGTGSNVTVGHGLSQAPELVINKSRSQGNVYAGWTVYSEPTWVSTTNTNLLYLNTSAGQADDTNIWQDAPTASLIQPQGGAWQGIGVSGEDYIAYCFHSVEGYSKIGSYEGNAATDGAFIYTGFRPAWVLIKSVDSSEGWLVTDDKRVGYNPVGQNWLLVNSSAAETTGNDKPYDYVSNGFKLRDGSALFNSASTYIYLAFAETPFKTANAR